MNPKDIDDDKNEFNVGDFVYHTYSGIGIITYANDGKYRVSYCQRNRIGEFGGDGPVWYDGYPKPVTDPSGVLFVAAFKAATRIEHLEKELLNEWNNLTALKRAMEIIK